MPMPKIRMINTGWLEGVEIHPSLNFNARPANTEINLLVIHCISLPPEQFSSQDVIDFFQNKLDVNKNSFYQQLQDMKVSAHFFITRTGSIVQFVSLLDRAWHAGVSSFMGVENCNDYSIGIELEGCDTIVYTQDQYNSLIKLTKLLQQNFPGIVKERITSHAEIALPKGRKTDPGPCFDWNKYLENL